MDGNTLDTLSPIGYQMILYLIRFVWIAAQVLVLIAGQDLKARYRAFAAYMLLSTMLSAAYWPELLPGWEQAFAPFLISVLLLRTLACLEALHHQTKYFPQWPRMMAGAFLLGFLVVILLAGVRDNQWAGLLVEYRRYLQIWLMVVMSVVELTMWDRGWGFTLRLWRRDAHVFVLYIMAVNHGLISWWCMAKHPSDGAWLNLNTVSTAVDAVLYMAWSCSVIASRQSVDSRLRGNPSLSVVAR